VLSSNVGCFVREYRWCVLEVAELWWSFERSAVGEGRCVGYSAPLSLAAQVCPNERWKGWWRDGRGGFGGRCMRSCSFIIWLLFREPCIFFKSLLDILFITSSLQSFNTSHSFYSDHTAIEIMARLLLLPIAITQRKELSQVMSHSSIPPVSMAALHIWSTAGTATHHPIFAERRGGEVVVNRSPNQMNRSLHWIR